MANDEDVKYGPELMDEMSAKVTVNTLLQRLPSTLTDKDYAQLVRAFRAERVHWQVKEERKKERKAGLVPGGVADEEEDEE